MARDRQRAKQRRARRAQNPGPAPSRPRRENVPGELDHASGEVEEFEASLIAGADGEPQAAGEPAAAPAGEEHPEELADEEFDELEDEVDGAGDEPAEQIRDRDTAVASTAAAPGAAAPPARRRGAAPGHPTQKGAGRFVGFLRASWAELQRVQWPDRRQVAQATAVVLGFVVIAGAYLGIADRIASELVDIII